MAGILGTLPDWVLSLSYLVAGVLFIQGLRDMTHPRTGARGNTISAVGMFLAVGITLLWFEILSPIVLLAALLVGSIVGVWLALTVETTEMPQLVGLYNGFGGGASALVAGAELIDQFNGTANSATLPGDVTAAAAVAGIIGSVTFWGSLVAAGKLHGLLDNSIRYTGEHVVKVVFLLVAVLSGVFLVVQPDLFGPAPLARWIPSYWAIVAAASILGVLLVAPIGGADMPVVIALLNSYSGLAAATTGFVLGNTVLIIAGTLVGASGLILTIIMCESMNRSLTNVLFGGLGKNGGSEDEDMEGIYEGNITATSPEEVEMVLDVAQRAVIVPGYGMAVAQAQYAVAELAQLLDENGVDVEFGIHPVAGRMPGHMNALLAEADVSYEKMRELEEVNPTFSQTDVVIVIGANDVVNPKANEDDGSPISGMPVLNVSDARSVIVNKRSLSPGFSGIPNPLFAEDDTNMLFGDAKETMQELVNVYKENH